MIAAIAGHAVAGGLELALWCDLRVADETAVFGVFCRRWGVPLIDGGTVRLPRLIGTSRALDMILTGRAVDAAEALAMGLANRVVPAARRWPRRRRWPPSWRRSRRPACATTGCRCWSRRASSEDAALRAEFAHGQVSLAADAMAGAARFAAGAGRHGAP